MFCFFFSSRRRHTRCGRDWSSDVCSSDLWKRQGFAPWLNRVTVPTLNVAGWWDQEDFYGPMKIYELLERHDSANQNFLVVGPWNHGGWSRGDGQKLGRLDFGSPASQHYRREVMTPFLAYHLKGKGKLDLPEALTFRTGTNEWVRHDLWPPKQNVVDRHMYFLEGRKLAFEAPKGGKDSYDTYVSDPANPVPYRPRPIDVNSGDHVAGGGSTLRGSPSRRAVVGQRPAG